MRYGGLVSVIILLLLLTSCGEGSSVITLSESSNNVVHTGDSFRLKGSESRFIIIIDDFFYDVINYPGAYADQNYTQLLKAPEIPGNYRIVVVQHFAGVADYTSYNLTVLGRVKSEDDAYQVVVQDLSNLYARSEDKSIENTTRRTMELTDEGWSVNLSYQYSFGCCRACPPDTGCHEMCVACGTVTGEASYLIGSDGSIKGATIQDLSCKPSERAWFRGMSGNDLCTIDGDNLS